MHKVWLYVLLTALTPIIACGGASRAKQEINLLPDEILLVVNNDHLNDVEIRITDRNCSFASMGKTLRVNGSEKRSFRLKAIDFHPSMFAFFVRVRTPTGFNVMPRACSEGEISPLPGARIDFDIPSRLEYLLPPAVFQPR